MKVYFKKIILSILAGLFIFSCFCLVACNDKSGEISIYPNSVECGKYFRVPELIGDDVKVQVVSPSKKKVTVTRGGFQMTEVGNYTINYTFGSKEKSISVACTKDVSYPYLQNGRGIQTKGDFFVGTYYSAIGVNLIDPSGICSEPTVDSFGNQLPGSYDYRFYYENESEPIAKLVGSNNTFLIERPGRYKVVLPAKDNLNNYHEYEFYFDAEIDYVDTDLVDENGEYKSEVIADFDDVGYLDNLTTSIEWGDRTENFYIENTADLKIIDGEPKNVLRAYPNEGYSEHFVMAFEFFKPISKDEVKYVYVKFYGKQRIYPEDAPDKPAHDYLLKLYANPYNLPDSYLFEYLEKSTFNCNAEDGAWTIARIPVNYLLYGNDEVKGIKFCVTGEICIEKIWISNYEFVDNDKISDNILCDFDESDYLYQVASYTRGDGANITHYSASDVEVLNNEDKIDGANTNGGVIAISSKSASAKSAWVNISLGCDVVANKNTKIVFKVYYVPRLFDRIFSNLIFNRVGLITHDGTENQYIQVIKNNSEASQYYERWTEFEIDSTLFAEENQSFDTVSFLVEGLIYIDQIEVR